jgi:hypothetical protein
MLLGTHADAASGIIVAAIYPSNSDSTLRGEPMVLQFEGGTTDDGHDGGPYPGTARRNLDLQRG